LNLGDVHVVFVYGTPVMLDFCLGSKEVPIVVENILAFAFPFP
jgi:hypothetical protein